MTESALQRHLKAIHEGNKKIEHKCDSCGKLFANAQILKKHGKNVHEGIKEYQCSTCEKAYVNQSDLKKHIKKLHS